VDYVTNPKIFKFAISENEKLEIINEYYLLNLDNLPVNTFIKDKCNIIPKNYTTLHINSKDLKQEIKIDQACNSYSFFDSSKANRVKKFLVK
jgi:hypothetical protein